MLRCVCGGHTIKEKIKTLDAQGTIIIKCLKCGKRALSHEEDKRDVQAV